MDISTITTEVRDALATTGITVASTVPDAYDVPIIILLPPEEVRYVINMTGYAELDFTVRLVVGAADLASAFALTYRLLSFGEDGATSIPDCLLTYSSNLIKHIKINRASNITPVGGEGIAISADLSITLTSRS